MQCALPAGAVIAAAQAALPPGTSPSPEVSSGACGPDTLSSVTFPASAPDGQDITVRISRAGPGACTRAGTVTCGSIAGQQDAYLANCSAGCREAFFYGRGYQVAVVSTASNGPEYSLSPDRLVPVGRAVLAVLS